ncbi:hypothetical protein [Scytonema sp. NUACC21]
MKFQKIAKVFLSGCFSCVLWLGVQQPEYIPLVAALVPVLLQVLSDDNRGNDDDDKNGS